MAISARKENLQSLIEYIKQNKPANYPIGNEELEKETDFIKNVYFKMLALVLQVGDFVSETQLNIYRRLLAGIGAQYEYSEYFRQALKVETGDFDEFVREYKTKDLRYRFVLDSILLCMDGERKKDQLEFVASMEESLGLKLDEAKYLTKLVKSILLQDSKIYSELQVIPSEQFTYPLFKDYIELFAKGYVWKTPKEVYLYSPSKEEFDIAGESKTLKFQETIVQFKNLIIDVSKIQLEFSVNTELKFENCEFKGGNYPISIIGTKEVEFKNCTFRNFVDTAIMEDGIGNVVFENCEFLDCKVSPYKYNRMDFHKSLVFLKPKESFGFFADEGERHKFSPYTINNKQAVPSNRFINTIFRNIALYYKRDSDYSSSGELIYNGEGEVQGCKFYNCWQYYDDGDKFKYRSLFYSGSIKESDNELIGSTELI